MRNKIFQKKYLLFALGLVLLSACSIESGETVLEVTPIPQEELAFDLEPPEVIVSENSQPTNTAALQPETQPTVPEPAEELPVSALPDLGPAPELVGDVWLNTDSPLRPDDLDGKVVLVDMWAYG
jgi:hypothetical protein